jgi:hypothetical protein
MIIDWLDMMVVYEDHLLHNLMLYQSNVFYNVHDMVMLYISRHKLASTAAIDEGMSCAPMFAIDN